VFNNSNRGLGQADAYSFVIFGPSVEKLRFVHETVATAKQRMVGQGVRHAPDFTPDPCRSCYDPLHPVPAPDDPGPAWPAAIPSASAA
jgi:hypothetical protein